MTAISDTIAAICTRSGRLIELLHWNEENMGVFVRDIRSSVGMGDDRVTIIVSLTETGAEITVEASRIEPGLAPALCGHYRDSTLQFEESTTGRLVLHVSDPELRPAATCFAIAEDSE